MSFSRGAARNFVPLLSRVVLAAAFIPAGWAKIMGEPVIYRGQDAETLLRLGIGEALPETASAITQSPVFQEDQTPGRLRDRIRPRPSTGEAGEPMPPAPAPLSEDVVAWSQTDPDGAEAEELAPLAAAGSGDPWSARTEPIRDPALRPVVHHVREYAAATASKTIVELARPELTVAVPFAWRMVCR